MEFGTPLPQAGEGEGVRVIAKPFAVFASTLIPYPSPACGRRELARVA